MGTSSALISGIADPAVVLNIPILDWFKQLFIDFINTWVLALLNFISEFFADLASTFLFFPPPAEVPGLAKMWDKAAFVFFLMWSLGTIGFLGAWQLFPEKEDFSLTETASRSFIAIIVVLISKPVLNQLIIATNALGQFIFPETYNLAFAAEGTTSFVGASLGAALGYFIALVLVYVISIGTLFIFISVLAMRILLIYVIYAAFPLLIGFWYVKWGPFKYSYSLAHTGFQTLGLLLGIGILVSAVIAGSAAIADFQPDETDNDIKTIGDAEQRVNAAKSSIAGNDFRGIDCTDSQGVVNVSGTNCDSESVGGAQPSDEHSDQWPGINGGNERRADAAIKLLAFFGGILGTIALVTSVLGMLVSVGGTATQRPTGKESKSNYRDKDAILADQLPEDGERTPSDSGRGVENHSRAKAAGIKAAGATWGSLKSFDQTMRKVSGGTSGNPSFAQVGKTAGKGAAGVGKDGYKAVKSAKDRVASDPPTGEGPSDVEAGPGEALGRSNKAGQAESEPVGQGAPSSPPELESGTAADGPESTPSTQPVTGDAPDSDPESPSSFSPGSVPHSSTDLEDSEAVKENHLKDPAIAAVATHPEASYSSDEAATASGGDAFDEWSESIRADARHRATPLKGEDHPNHHPDYVNSLNKGSSPLDGLDGMEAPESRESKLRNLNTAAEQAWYRQATVMEEAANNDLVDKQTAREVAIGKNAPAGPAETLEEAQTTLIDDSADPDRVRSIAREHPELATAIDDVEKLPQSNRELVDEELRRIGVADYR